MTDSILAAAARGATLVTPNKRLARDVVARHDAAQRAAGRTAWVAARALPWTRFVTELWQAAQDGGLPVPQRRLDAAQSAHLWRGIVEAGLASRPLVDVDAAAALAAEAWELVHAHGAGGESWRGFTAVGDDAEAFARWAETFSRENERIGALDVARIPEWLARHAPTLPGVASIDAALFGFLEPTAQQLRFVDALRLAGARIEFVGMADDVSVSSRAWRASAPSERDELLLALRWARERALASPETRVGIVVPGLAAKQAMVRALADEVLCPGLQWPDALDRPRPYNVSAGEALSAVPLVAAALRLIALANGPLDVADAATLLRSPYLPGGVPCWTSRAALERRWIEGAVRELTLDAIVAALAAIGDPLVPRWRALRQAARVPARATPRAWADFWRAWLDAAGFCEGRPLGSAEFQARGAWADLLEGFVRLGAVAPELVRDDALAAVRRAAAAQTFQPESVGARVEVLGMLEAAGLGFDALWVTGLTAEAWPEAPDPNPLLPIAWQRERNVPHSHASRELAYARRLTASLSRAADEVVFSFAESVDGHPCAPSPLIAGLAPWRDAIPALAPTAQAQYGSRPALETLRDAVAPAVPEGARMRGGAGLIDAQSACPFKAVALHRLEAREWPTDAPGLSKLEQGTIVHAALAAFWREVHDQSTFLAMDGSALDAAIERAAAIGLRAVPQERWATLPPVVAGGEGRRVASLVRDWLERVERERAPFVVIDTEARREVSLAGLALDVTLDRVDRLGDAAVAIIDYKTGRASPPAKWFGERPQAPQLAVYALAHAQAGGEPVTALVYAQLRPGELRAVGVAASPGAWPALADPRAATGSDDADWRVALGALETQAIALAGAVRAGDARIAPRDDDTCRQCALQPVCRIRAVRDLAAEAAPEGNGDG